MANSSSCSTRPGSPAGRNRRDGRLGLFYRALGEGALAVVAPVTAVTSAAIPVVGGLVPRGAGNGLRPLSIGCALAAIALISLAPR